MSQGFFCTDLSIRYPYQECTITVSMLVVIMLLLPILFISVVEIIRVCNDFRIREYLRNLCHSLATFSFGFIATYLTTELAKNVVGRLRPHFYTACKPRLVDGRTCEDLNGGINAYVDQYVCSNNKLTAFQLRELYVSFPSAHAALSFYAMLFLCFYLHKVWRRGRGICRALRHIAQFLNLMMAWYIALTRVVDHWHHWSDVLAGAVMGVLYAIITACYIANMVGINVPTTTIPKTSKTRSSMSWSAAGCQCCGSRGDNGSDGECDGRHKTPGAALYCQRRLHKHQRHELHQQQHNRLIESADCKCNDCSLPQTPTVVPI